MSFVDDRYFLYIYSNKPHHMFKQFDEDLTYLPKKKFHAKYTIPFLLCILTLVIIGQLILISFPLSRLNSVQGRIANVQTRIVSWLIIEVRSMIHLTSRW